MTEGKPELKDDRFIQLAHRLDAALDVANLTKAERIILREVKAQCFGVAAIGSPLKAARIVPGEIAGRIGCLRQFLNKGVLGLVKAGILVEAKGGEDTYKLNKYFRTWRHNDGTVIPETQCRFTEGELTYIESAPIVAAAYAKGSAPESGDNPTDPEPQKRNPLVSEAKPVGFGGETGQFPNRNQTVSPAKPDGFASGLAPNRSACVGENLEKKREAAAAPASPATDPRRDKLVAMAEGLAPLEGSASKIDGFIACYGLDATEAALIAAMTAEKRPANVWRYMARCLADWKAEGRTFAPKAKRPEPATMSERTAEEMAIPYIPILRSATPEERKGWSLREFEEHKRAREARRVIERAAEAAAASMGAAV